MDPYTAAMIGTAVIGAYSSYTAGQQQQEAYKQQAKEKRRLARVLMEDFETNALLQKREGKKFASRQQTAFAKSGVDIASGSPLLAMEDTISAVNEQISMDRRRAMAEATAMQIGADLDTSAGSAAARSGGFQAIGQLGQGIAGATR